MADNRKIRNKIRGEKGQHFDYGMEDGLAAAYDQKRLDELKEAGAIEGDWRSTKPAMTVTGDNFSKEMAGKIAGSGAEVAIAGGDSFQPLSIEETVDAMKKYDFSEQVTRSMTFHGDTLKEALKGGSKTGEKSSEKSKDNAPVKDDPPTDDFPKGFPAYGKVALKKLGKTFADIKDLSREKLIELNGIADQSADDIITFISDAKKSEEK